MRASWEKKTWRREGVEGARLCGWGMECGWVGGVRWRCRGVEMCGCVIGQVHVSYFVQGQA